ncbi:MAG TPA: FAD-binding oxidoreductase [Candidatus Sulfotelmatobacter sp.]|jgi:putative aminophosphonate oxidoreductase|nr:FAD-binding oxidoreductase [Candidatus Sulfotelmatobacter sp.]
MRRSLWLQEVADDLQQVTSLKDDVACDVAIVGGGFVGLWTALRIKELSPDSSVVVLEQDVCGGGASGRNGGFVMSWWPKISSLAALCGRDEALRLARLSETNIGEIGAFCAQHGIDAHFRQSGWLWTATTEAQRGAWRGVQETCVRLGHDVFAPVASGDLVRRSGSSVHLEGVVEASNATVQPARLVRGLRRVALDKGVSIFEKTRVVHFERGQPARLRTPSGSVGARRVVLATNAWASAIAELRLAILPVTSTIVATRPMPERLEAIGWTGGEAVTDSQLMVDYYRTTRDGRIAFGKGTGMIAFASRFGSGFDQNPELDRMTEADFRRVYPHLGDVEIEHAWSGPIDRTYDSVPMFGHLTDAPHIVYGLGWSGNGVGPSRIGGRILASLALGLDDEWSRCGLVNRKVKAFPPEPIRYVGGLLVRNAVFRKETAEAKGGKPRWLDKTLAGFAPSGLEDKSA